MFPYKKGALLHLFSAAISLEPFYSVRSNKHTSKGSLYSKGEIQAIHSVKFIKMSIYSAMATNAAEINIISSSFSSFFSSSSSQLLVISHSLYTVSFIV